MKDVKEIVVDVSGLDYCQATKVIEALNELQPLRGETYAHPSDGVWYFCIDSDGDIDASNHKECFKGNLEETFPVYTPEQFWQEFGESKEKNVSNSEAIHKLKPEDLAFGKILHTRDVPYVFISWEDVADDLIKFLEGNKDKIFEIMEWDK